MVKRLVEHEVTLEFPNEGRVSESIVLLFRFLFAHVDLVCSYARAEFVLVSTKELLRVACSDYLYPQCLLRPALASR